MKNFFTTALIVTFIALTGCGDGDSSAKTGDTFEGAFAGANNENGTLALTLGAESARLAATRLHEGEAHTTIAVTGVLKLSGSTIDLVGTYHPDTGDFSLTGGGYTFTGNFKDGILTGEYSGPNGNGKFTASKGTTQVFCGTYDSEDDGIFQIVVGADGKVSGSHSSTTDGNDGILTGEREGDNFEVSSTDGGGAHGTISGNSVSGTVEDDNGDANGTFEGSTGACP